MTLPLFQGVTFRVERGEMVIARILHGSSIDRQGMLHTGDIIREVNGREVGSNPHELQELLRDCSGSITLKVLPSYKNTPAPPQVRKEEAAFEAFLLWGKPVCQNTGCVDVCVQVYTGLYLSGIG